MATITSAASGDATAGTTWLGGVAPGPDDDVVIAGHTVTFDADLVWTSLTINNASGRLAMASNVSRTINLTGQFRRTANSSATVISIPTGSHLTVICAGFRATVSMSQPIFTVAAANARLTLSGGGSDSELLDPTTSVTERLFAMSVSSAVVETRGRISVSGGTTLLAVITGGTWDHEHTGISYFNGTTTGKILTASGAALQIINFRGDVVSLGATTTTGVFQNSGSNSVCTLTGNFYQAVANTGGALLYVLGGLLILNGKVSHISGSNSLSVWVAGGTFRWTDQNRVYQSTESFTLIASAGYVELYDLVIENHSRVIGVLYGTANFATGGFTILNQPGGIAGFNHVDILVINSPQPAPSLPAPGDVVAGIVYGYPDFPQIGGGLIIDPASLTASVAAALENISVSALKRWVTVDTGETEAVAGSVAKLSGGDIESGDWTDTEKRQIRHRLGINGDLASPTQVPSLARPGDAMNLTLAAMQSASGQIAVDINQWDEVPGQTAWETAVPKLRQAIWGHSLRTLTGFDIPVNLSAAQVSNLVSLIEAEIADDATGAAVKQAIIDKLLENLPELDDLSLAAIAQAVWGHSQRLLTGFGFQVTVAGYATGQSPADLVDLSGLALSSQLPVNLANLAIDAQGQVEANNVQITVQPTELSVASVEAITSPLLTAIESIDVGGPEARLLTVETTVDSEPVSGVAIRVAGRTIVTQTDGTAKLPLNPGNYSLRVIPPNGFADVADFEVIVGDDDLTQSISLTSLIPLISPPPGTCAFTVRVASQAGSNLAGIYVSARLPKGYVVNVDTLNINLQTSQLTNNDGLATLILLRDQSYELVVRRPDSGIVTLPIRTPDTQQATLSQVIEV